ncbi:MAG: TonB-dependent receptor [Hyphomonadaceae bacterium]
MLPMRHFDERPLTLRLMCGAMATSLCTAALAPMALAQETDDEKRTDRVVVTATQVATDIDRLPARVAVITREDFEDYNYVTAVEALQATPGLTVVQSGGAGAITSVFSRGTNSKHTLALFDGIRLNDPSAPNGQYNFGQDTTGDLERIEVVRGAASSIYGSDAVGGVINFIPRVGGDTPFAGSYEVAVGDRDTYRGTASARGTVGAASYAISGEHFETGGFNNTPDRFPDNLGEDDGSTFNTLTGVGDLRVNDLATIRGLVRWRKAETDIDSAALDRIASKTDDQYLVWRVGSRLQLLDDRLTVDVNGGQVKNERSSTDAADANQPYPAPNSSAEGTRTFANWRNIYEFEDTGALSDASINVGVEWQDEDISSSGGYSDALSRSESNLALYALLRGRLADRIDLSGSVRRDDTDSFGEATTWNLGAVVDIPEAYSRVYVSAGTSFKAPTLSERFSTSSYVSASPDLKPEEGDGWEAGFDFEPPIPGADARFGFTWFKSDIDNLIESQYDVGSGLYKNINIGVAKIEGYETYLEASPFPQLTGRIAYTYTDARNGDTDARLLRRPPHQWSASAKLQPTDKLSMTLSYLRRGHREDVYYSDTNPYGKGGGYLGNRTVDAYELLNAVITYKATDAISVYGSVRNLTDESYEDPSAYRGEPITWTIGLRGTF